ncbi:hypothetical protein HRI_004193200 [Hibiscus trionum]|uniref:Uncharacterized protein n=1 Tax=Hibiscus trionum TaxID=183268 RepID=A0A9W7IZ70_HIBTR|nr:hypothetical protein HRI_004193200 [Hibiscus trionum]
MASPPLSNNNEPSNVSYDLHDFQTSIFIYLMGLVLVILSVQIIERVHNLLRNEIDDQLDIESDQLADHHPSITDDFDWYLEPMNNLWAWEIFNGFMAHLDERRPGDESRVLGTSLAMRELQELGGDNVG